MADKVMIDKVIHKKNIITCYKSLNLSYFYKKKYFQSVEQRYTQYGNLLLKPLYCVSA